MPDDLRSVQRWFAALVRHPVSAEAALEQLPARALIAPAVAQNGGIVRGGAGPGGAQLDPVARVGIYTRAYAARLFDAIAEDYPGLRVAIGDEAFGDLLRAYLRAHPSRHQNLIFAGRHLPAFVAHAPLVPHRDFAADVARVEWAMTEAFHAEEFTPADLSVLASLDADATDRVRLRLNPSVRLLALRYPVIPFLDCAHGETKLPVPEAKHSWAVVHRHDDRVYRTAVPGFVHRTLSALGESRPLGDALADADPSEVGVWFERWSAYGLFESVDEGGGVG